MGRQGCHRFCGAAKGGGSQFSGDTALLSRRFLSQRPDPRAPGRAPGAARQAPSTFRERVWPSWKHRPRVAQSDARSRLPTSVRSTRKQDLGEAFCGRKPLAWLFPARDFRESASFILERQPERGADHCPCEGVALQACVRGARRPPPPRSWPALPPAALVQGARPQPARAAASGEARPRALGSVSAYYLHIYFTSSVQPNLRPLILMRGDDSDDELVKHSASPCAVCSLRLMSP